MFLACLLWLGFVLSSVVILAFTSRIITLPARSLTLVVSMILGSIHIHIAIIRRAALVSMLSFVASVTPRCMVMMMLYPWMRRMVLIFVENLACKVMFLGGLVDPPREHFGHDMIVLLLLAGRDIVRAVCSRAGCFSSAGAHGVLKMGGSGSVRMVRIFVLLLACVNLAKVSRR